MEALSERLAQPLGEGRLDGISNFFFKNKK